MEILLAVIRLQQIINGTFVVRAICQQKNLSIPKKNGLMLFIERLDRGGVCNNDGRALWYSRVGYRLTWLRRGAASVYEREFEYPIAASEDSPFRSHAPAGKLEYIML
mgnify:CR=1 FL=1